MNNFRYSPDTQNLSRKEIMASYRSMLEVKADLYSILQTGEFMRTRYESGTIDSLFYHRRMKKFHAELVKIEKSGLDLAKRVWDQKGEHHYLFDQELFADLITYFKVQEDPITFGSTAFLLNATKEELETFIEERLQEMLPVAYENFKREFSLAKRITKQTSRQIKVAYQKHHTGIKINELERSEEISDENRMASASGVICAKEPGKIITGNEVACLISLTACAKFELSMNDDPTKMASTPHSSAPSQVAR